MFGYVLPDCSKLSVRDFSLYRAIYCGICLATKHEYGNLPRMTVNYDITTFAALATEAEAPALQFGMCRCIGDVRRKPYVKDCEFMRRMAGINILLCYYKALDDVLDSGKKSSLPLRVLKKPYMKAKAAYPEADGIIARGYEKLRELEAANCTSTDRASDCFAGLLSELFAVTSLGGRDEYYSEQMRKLCYNVGKFVYLADALDDIEEDHAAKRYNPVLAAYAGFDGDRAAYFAAHSAELRFTVNSTVNRAIECSNGMTFTQADGLLRNIIYDGLRAKADELFASRAKLPPPKVRVAKSVAKDFSKQMKAERARRKKGQ